MDLPHSPKKGKNMESNSQRLWHPCLDFIWTTSHAQILSCCISHLSPVVL